MASSTYRDLIDDKVAAWHKALKQLEDQTAKASSETRANRTAKLDQLRLEINSAADRLHYLDQQEHAGNTMEIKDKILEIFNAIDKDFPRYEEKTPYML